MQRNIFGYILAHSARQQLIILGMTVASIPFYYASLDLPKRIINQAIDASPELFPRALKLGSYQLATLGQLEFLILLSFGFLVFVLINGGVNSGVKCNTSRR